MPRLSFRQILVVLAAMVIGLALTFLIWLKILQNIKNPFFLWVIVTSVLLILFYSRMIVKMLWNLLTSTTGDGASKNGGSKTPKRSRTRQ
jgi:uncharacterized protein YacL